MRLLRDVRQQVLVAEHSGAWFSLGHSPSLPPDSQRSREAPSRTVDPDTLSSPHRSSPDSTTQDGHVGARRRRQELSRGRLRSVRDRGALLVGLAILVVGIVLVLVGPWVVGLVVAVLGAGVAAVALRS